MKTKTALIALVILILPLVLAQDFPPLPTGYWGYVTDSDGNPVSDVIVTARQTNAVVGTANSATNSDGLYSLRVLWDNTNTAEDEGVSAGDLIFFYAGDEFVTRVGIADQGLNVRLDLEIPSEVTFTNHNNNNDVEVIPEETVFEEEVIVEETFEDEATTDSRVTNLTEEKLVEESNKLFSPLLIVIIAIVILGIIGFIIFKKKR